MSGEYEYIKRADIMEALTSAEMQRIIKVGDGTEAYRLFLDIVLAAQAAPRCVTVRHKGKDLPDECPYCGAETGLEVADGQD